MLINRYRTRIIIFTSITGWVPNVPCDPIGHSRSRARWEELITAKRDRPFLAVEHKPLIDDTCFWAFD